MKEHGIIFQGWGVRAIQNCKPNVWPAEPIDPGKPFKWQTRRVIQPQPTQLDQGDIGRGTWYWKCAKLEAGYCHTQRDAMERLMLTCCPYGIPGDRLVVRETWAVGACADGFKPRCLDPKTWRKDNGGCWYRADGHEPSSPISPRGKWRPSIFMPRWVARELPIVKAIRAERVQEISEEDAKAEGVIPCRPPGSEPDEYRYVFPSVWNRINAKAKRAKHNPYTNAREDCYVLYPWEDVRKQKKLKSGLIEYTVGNPWNFAIDFMRVEADSEA